MTSTWSSSVALICTAVLLWKPVLVSPAFPPPPVCPIPQTGLRISVLNDPPYTEFKSGEVKGVLGEFFTKMQKKCFQNSLECKSVSRNVTILPVNSTANFSSIIKRNRTDIAFPITAPMKMALSGDRYHGPPLIFEVFIKSTGYSLIMDVENFNRKSNDIVFDTLLANTWPIFVFTLLIAGISGICVWMLVSKIHIRTYIALFALGFKSPRAFNHQMRDRPLHLELRPLLLSIFVWVLLRPTELIMNSCKTGPTAHRLIREN